MDLFPYTLRQNQKAIISTIKNTLENRENFILESGTGSGKTICALSATLPYALEHDKKIVYITRTNSQQRQVIMELRSIYENIKEDAEIKESLFGVGIQGRSNMCPQAREDKDLKEGNSEELSKYCANEKKKARTSKKGCMYYRNFVEKKELINQTSNWVRKQMPTAEEFIEHCTKKHLCPYELNKSLVREARVVVLPYIYVFNATIRNMLFDWLGVSEEDIILIVDEAHNLPDYIRDLFSTQLSVWMCKNCGNEARNYGDPSTGSGRFSISSFCNTLEDIIRELRDTYVYNILEEGIRKQSNHQSDAFLPRNEFLNEIYSRMKLNEKKMFDIIEDLVAYGEKIQEDKQKKNKLPRSYLHKLGLFLEFWMNLTDNQYAKLSVDASDGKNPRIEAYCLDPSVGTNIINKFHSSIHMSGTLEPLEEYRDSMGLSHNTTLISFSSPFPKENRKLLYLPDVTTKYSELMKDDTIQKKMWEYITTICNKFPQNTIVFFPSYNTLSLFQRNHDFSDIKKSVFLEEQRMSQTALMDLVSDFKNQGNKLGIGATLFSVIGGRISEGMDFPSKQLEIVLIVGIPYPKPTARQRGLQKYYEMKFHKGWEYTVQAPTARKLLQAIGRLIRDEKDKGVAIILDRRAPRFKPYLKELGKSIDIMKEIESTIG
ncbi:DEAD/DEAH box helicase [Thermoplasmatales archaeon ex4572_165]|nr:MAG: DEAD/DEAH box helicase [Thermoplasmatales archaeon ex4572_165]